MLMRLRLILFIVGGSIALLIYGIDNISNSAGDDQRAGRNKKCVTLTYEQFVQRHPTEGWFHITGGVLDLPSARAHITAYGHSEEAKNNGTVNSLDIPLRSAKNYDSDDAPPSPILITTNNSDLMEKWKALDELGQGQTNDDGDEDGQKASPKASKSVEAAQKARFKKYVTENWEKIYVPQDVEGILKTDAGSEKSDDASEPDAAPDNMTANYVVLDDGKTGADYKTRSTKAGVIALTILAAFWGIVIFIYALGRRPGSGGGGGDMVTLTNRHGEAVNVNADFVNRFRTGGTGSRQENPWSNHR